MWRQDTKGVLDDMETAMEAIHLIEAVPSELSSLHDHLSMIGREVEVFVQDYKTGLDELNGEAIGRAVDRITKIDGWVDTAVASIEGAYASRRSNESYRPVPTDTPLPNQGAYAATPEPATPTSVPPTEVPSSSTSVLEGRGQDVTAMIAAPANVNKVTVSHAGESNFIVKALEVGKDRELLLVNTIGNYNGSTFLPSEPKKLLYFEVKADGPWTIAVEGIGVDPAAAEGIEGSGDSVSGLFVPKSAGRAPYTFMHDGEDNFIVRLYCAGGGSEVVQNEIGAVSGSALVRFTDGPCAWEVQADGNWSIRPKR